MSDPPKIWSGEFCRRSILRSVVFTAADAEMLRTTMSGNRVTAAETKATQKAVEYQDTSGRFSAASNGPPPRMPGKGHQSIHE
jgi:hypothetical protein